MKPMMGMSITTVTIQSKSSLHLEITDEELDENEPDISRYIIAATKQLGWDLPCYAQVTDDGEVTLFKDWDGEGQQPENCTAAILSFIPIPAAVRH